MRKLLSNIFCTDDIFALQKRRFAAVMIVWSQ